MLAGVTDQNSCMAKAIIANGNGHRFYAPRHDAGSHPAMSAVPGTLCRRTTTASCSNGTIR